MITKLPIALDLLAPPASNPAARGRWVAANAAVITAEQTREPLDLDPVALGDAGVVVRTNGTVAWTANQVRALTEAFVAAGGSLDAAGAIAALTAERSRKDAADVALEASRQTLYTDAIAKLNGAGAGLANARAVVAFAAEQLAGLAEDAPQRPARETALRQARATLDALIAQADDEHDAALLAIQAVPGSCTQGVRDAVKAARERLGIRGFENGRRVR